MEGVRSSPLEGELLVRRQRSEVVLLLKCMLSFPTHSTYPALSNILLTIQKHVTRSAIASSNYEEHFFG